jgi:hypothetical protein
MKYLAGSLAIGIAAVLAAPTVSPAPQDKDAAQTLVYAPKCKKGDKFRYRISYDNVSVHDVPASHEEPRTTANEGTLIYTEEVKETRADGGATLLFEYQELVARHPDGRPMMFDKKELPRYERIVDKRGETVDERVLSGPLRPDIVEYLALLSPPEGLPWPPGEALRVGDKRESIDTDDREDAKGVHLKTILEVLRLEEVDGEPCVRIAVAMVYTIKERRDNVSIPTVGAQKGSTEATYWVRVSDCRIVKAEETTTLTLDGKVAAAVGTQAGGILLKPGDIYRTTQTSTIQLTLLRDKEPAPREK